MPYQTVFVPPELFLTHNGVKVYHCYKNDDIEDYIHKHWYTLNAQQDNEEDKFDIREIDVPEKEQLNAHPPYIGTVNPEWVAADQAQRQIMGKKWEEWLQIGFLNAAHNIVTSAIDKGILKA